MKVKFIVLLIVVILALALVQPVLAQAEAPLPDAPSDDVGNVVSVVAGIVLSLLFSYVPGVQDWFGNLDGTRKRLVMLLVCALAASVIYAASCAGLAYQSTITCDKQGLMALLQLFAGAVVANQMAYLLISKPGSAQTVEPPR
jgi:hypothetical protein